MSDATATENRDHLEAMAANEAGHYEWGVSDVLALDWALAELARLSCENAALKRRRAA